MSIDTGRERTDEKRRPQRRAVRLTPDAKPGQAGELLAPSPSQESADRSKSGERNESSSPREDAKEGARGLSLLPTWLRRLGFYGLALLFVAMAAMVRWALGDVLSPTPGLVFYLAWVGAAAFGGLGPGLLATLASWWCIGFLFDSPPWQVGFGDPASVARILIFLAGGLAVSVVGETMRRSRIHKRRQGQELAAANAALRASEEKYRLLVENSKDITGTIDLQGRCTFVSSNVEKMTGYRADEVVGKTIWDLLAPECRDLVKENVRRRLRGEDVPPYELLAVGKDGRRIPFELVMASIVDDDGSIVGTQAVLRDITERQRAEEALRASEEKYRFLVENSKDVTWAMDLQGRWTFISGNVEKVAGYRVEEVIGKTLWDFLAPECHDLVKDKLRRRVRGEDLPPYEILIVGKDGRRMPFEVHAVSVVDDRGNIVGLQGVSRDITERKRAEAALRESEEKYRFLVENSKDITWMVDLQGTWTFISGNVEEVAGYRADEVVGRTIWDFLAPECHDLVRENLRRRLRGEDVPPYEVLVVGKDGRHTPFEVVTSSIVDEAGNVAGVQGVSRDVTERKRAEAALRESEEKYRLLVENSKDITWTVDLQGHWTFISSNLEKVTGHRADELIGQSLWDFLAPESRDLVKENLRRRLRGEDLPPYEVTFVAKDGRHMPFEVLAASIVDDRGNMVGVQGVSRDITERKRAEVVLAESRKKYRDLVEKINDWVWEIDASGVYTYVSPRALELLGYAPEEIVGKTPFDLMPPAEAQRVWKAFEPIWLGRKPLELLENTLVRKDGRLVTVETSGMPMFAEDGTFRGYTGVDRDVTARKRAEEALQKSEEKFAKAFRSSPIAIAVTRLSDGRILDANEAMLKLLHFTADEVIGHTTRELDIWVDPHDRAQFTQGLSTAGSVRDLEYRLRAKDGAIVTIHLSAELLEFSGERCMLSTLVDVTERERAAEALRQEKTFTDKLLNAPRDTVFLFEPATGQPIRWNKRFAEVSGYDDEEIAGMRAPDDFYDENDLKKARESIAKIAAEGQGVVELSLVTKRGTHIPFEYAATVVEAEDGKTLLLSIGRDVTERTQAEEALRESQRRLERAQEIAHLGSWELDLASDRLTWSDEVYRIFGLQPQEFSATYEAFLDCVYPEDRAAVDAAYSGSLREGRDTYEIEHRVVRRSTGEIRLVHEKCEHVRDVSGRIIRSIGMVHDITERKRAEEALRESEERFRIMADGSPNPIWATDAEGQRVFANKQYLEYFGISKQEIDGGEWKPFLHPEDAPTYVNSFLSSLKEHRPFSAEARVRRADGQWRWIESHAEPRLSSEGAFLGFVGITQDITGRKQAEQDLRELNATLESKVARRTEELEHRARQLQKLTLDLTEAEERERARIAEILHDDLQQVLAAAKFQVSLLSSRIKNDADAQEIAGQAKDLLTDAIARSRGLSHELSSPALAQSDLSTALEWLAEHLQTKHGFTVHLEAGEQIEVASEPLRILLYKAAQELLFNAIKHAGVQEAKVRLRRQRGWLRLSVSDQGRGFDPTDPSYKLGFGLLSIRERIGLLGGRLKIRSAVGRGSTFVITVPDAEGSP